MAAASKALFIVACIFLFFFVAESLYTNRLLQNDLSRNSVTIRNLSIMCAAIGMFFIAILFLIYFQDL